MPTPKYTIVRDIDPGLVDAMIAKASFIGGETVKEPQDADWGGYSGYFRDPDGFLWEIAWNPHFWIE